MANEPDRRIGWPVLVVLVAFFASSAYLVVRVHENSPADAAPVPGALLGGEGAGDTYQHHAWTPDGGAAEPGPAAADPTGRDRFYDPQSWRMLRSFGVESLDAGVDLPFDPVDVAAEITESSGATPVDDDAACALRVLPVQGDEHNCLVRVLCEGHVLYPNQSQTAGHVRCAIADHRVHHAEDGDHSAVDGDPLIRFDLRLGTATVEDRGVGVERFSVTFHLQS